MRKVLVTGAGGPSGIAFMQAASADFHAADADRFAPGLYLVESSRRHVLPLAQDEGFVDHLLSLAHKEEIDVIVPTVDQELLPLAKRREEFHQLGTDLLLAPQKALELCLDKFALMQKCEEFAPQSALAAHASVLEWDFPVIAKPRRGSGGRGVEVVRSQEELDRVSGEDTLIQEMLPGVEYSIDVLATTSGEVKAVVPRSRLKVDSGIALVGRTVKDEQLERVGREVFERAGLSGVANVQVKMSDKGEPKLLEVNPRFPGTMPLTVASGINMPQLALDSLEGAELPTQNFKEVAITRFFKERVFDPDELGRVS